MTQAPSLPSMPIGADATTDDCKALLGSVDPSAFGAAGPSGAWKRISKRGSGALVERSFEHASGLAALVLQTHGRLWVAALAKKIENLPPGSAFASQAAAFAAKAAAEAPASLEARAPAAEAKRVAKLLASAQDDGDDEVYGALMQKAGKEPAGSPLRIALGNLFEFSLPTQDEDCEGMFEIVAKDWEGGLGPSPDQPHFLEEFFGYDVIESPNESSSHWIHLSAQKAIALLLSSGIGPSADAMDLAKMEEHDPAYAAVMLPLIEARALNSSVQAGSAAPRPKPL